MVSETDYDINFDIKLENTTDYANLEAVAELNEQDCYVYLVLKDFYINCDDYPKTRAFME